MITEKFAEGDSYLHRFDPRYKLIVAITFSLVTALCDRPYALVGAVAFSLILTIMARLNLRGLFYRLLLVNGFIAFLWLFLPFTYHGRPLFTLGPLQATYEGIHLATIITVKSNSIILATIALLGTSNVFSLVHAMRHLKLPDKLVHLFFFCFRYIHVLQLEFDRLNQAVRIRNFQPRTNLHTLKTLAYMVGMLLINSYDRSQRVYQAMLCRGFRGKYHLLHHFSTRPLDSVALSLMMLYIAGVAVIQWTHFQL